MCGYQAVSLSKMATNREDLARKCSAKRRFSFVNDEVQARLKQIKSILQKGTEKCSEEELDILRQSPEMVKEIERRAAKQANAKARVKEVVLFCSLRIQSPDLFFLKTFSLH